MISNSLNIVVLAGLGGIGKTQLALQYITNNKQPYTLCGWFSAENIDHLYQNYIDFAKFLGYKDEHPNIKKVAAYVKDWLENNPGWLLVYDNVSNYEKIAPFLPQKGGNVILTTRQQHWPDKFTVLPVKVMTEEEATGLMGVLVKNGIEEKSKAKQLLRSIGYLPLAIVQAGTYIHQNKIKVSEYLDIYKKYEQELLSEAACVERKKNSSVATTWNISFDAIIGESESKLETSLTQDILLAFAYLAPEKITREMLVFLLKTKQLSLSSPEIVLNKILRRLWRYSIISYDKDGFISIHRLVQCVLRHQCNTLDASNRVGNIQALYTYILKSINAVFCKERSTLEKEKVRKFLLPHLQSLVKHYDDQVWDSIPLRLALSNILKNIGEVFHYYMGAPYRAKPYYKRALFIKKKYYGANHIEVARILTQFGDAYGALGDPNKQKDFLEKALKITEEKYGKDHKELILVLESLGASHWALGNAKKSREILEKVLRLGEKFYGKESVRIAKILYYLGNVQGDLGDARNQVKTLERALTINEQQYGKEHIRISFVLENLGIAYRHLGKLQKSRKLLTKALAIQERYYGKRHVEVGETLANLSNTYLALKRPLKAKKLLKRSLEILENYYGKNHMYFARTLSYLGDVYICLEEYKKAAMILKKTLHIKNKYYGENHFSTAQTKASLGEAYLKIKNFKKAKLFLSAALKVQKKHYGKNHPIYKRTFLLQECARKKGEQGDL